MPGSRQDKDYDAMRAYLDLWEKQAGAAVKDPFWAAMAQTWTDYWRGMMAGAADGAKQTADFKKDSDINPFPGFDPAHVADFIQAWQSRMAASLAPDRSAERADLAQLRARLAACEERISAMERSLEGRGKSSRPKTGRTRSKRNF